MDVLKQLEDILKPQHQLVAAGVPSERATEIVTNLDLSFTARKGSVTNRYRERLKEIAQGIDVNINFLLNSLTPGQIAEVIEEHQHILWDHPEEIGNGPLQLNDLNKEGEIWWLTFEDNFGGAMGAYQLHDLNIQDVLGLLATIENILAP